MEGLTPMTIENKVYYTKGSIKVTDTFLTTRYKDEALSSEQSVRVGREPLLIAGILGIGLTLFANRFGSLLYRHEQILLVCIGLGIIAGGYSIAALRIGQYMHERTVLWSTIGTVNDVRKAIGEAKTNADTRIQRQFHITDISE